MEKDNSLKVVRDSEGRDHLVKPSFEDINTGKQVSFLDLPTIDEVQESLRAEKIWMVYENKKSYYKRNGDNRPIFLILKGTRVVGDGKDRVIDGVLENDVLAMIDNETKDKKNKVKSFLRTIYTFDTRDNENYKVLFQRGENRRDEFQQGEIRCDSTTNVNKNIPNKINLSKETKDSIKEKLGSKITK